MITIKKRDVISKEEQRLAAMPERELRMREAAATVSSVVAILAGMVKPGVNVLQLEVEARKIIKEFGAEPYNMGYKPSWAREAYPAATCLSVNNVVAHGIPHNYILQEGDTINIDLGIKFNGYCGDCAMTVPVGQIENKNERLMRYANRACYVGIEKIKAGVTVMDIAQAVDQYVKQMGYYTNMVFSGHDIGEEMHGTGLVIPFFYDSDPRYLKQFAGLTLKAGQVVCIEPMITRKDRTGRLLANGWTLETRDGSNSAMFEHMVLVKEDGYEVLTDHFKKL